MLPFVEAEAQVSLLVLLSISEEVKPVFHDFAEGNETSPPVEHLGLEVVIGSIPALPAANRFGKEIVSLVLGVVRNVIHLDWCETFILHEILEVGDIHTLVKHLPYDRSHFVNLEHCLSELGLFLPHVESIADLCRDEVTKHYLFLLHYNLVTMSLSSHMRVVLEQLPSVDLGKATCQVTCRNIPLVLANVGLAADIVPNHLEGTLLVPVVELCGGVGETQDQSLVPVMLQHELSEDGTLVDKLTLLVELEEGSSSSNRCIFSCTPFLD